MRKLLSIPFAYAAILLSAGAQAPDFRRIMITEVSWAEPQGIEITNFSPAAIDLSGWRVTWILSNPGVSPLFPLSGSIQPGESLIVAEASVAGMSNPYLEAPPGTRIIPVLTPHASYTTARHFALLNPASLPVDVVHVSATGGTSSLPSFAGGAFRGLAVRSVASAMSVERIWGLDSDGGRDWSEENVRSFGLENRSSGPRGTDPVAEPRILITEIDDSPDYIELHNGSAAAVDLANFLILASGEQGVAPVRILPFPAAFVLPAGAFVVVGDAAAAPAEKPAGVPYVNLGAIGGGSLPMHWEEMTLGLYDALGRCLDLVRATGGDDGVVHNHPRLPSAWNAFSGAAARLNEIGDGSFGRPMVGPNFVDSDRGTDWRALFSRSMGSYNPMWVGNPGLGDLLDVRMNETGLGDGLTIVINAGASSAGRRHSFFLSAGHAVGQGPFFGLGPDAPNNWLAILAAPPFSGVLDAAGSARVDLPPGSLPSGLAFDCIFILQDAAGLLRARTAILEFDT